MDRQGVCHLCGAYGKLSKEHVPPQKAFNINKAYVFNANQIFGTKRLPWNFSGLKGTQHQGGVGWYTLCPKCNNDTGAYYANNYVDFVSQAMSQQHLYQDAPNRTWTTMYFRKIYPARVLKQIITMFFSINEPTFAQKQYDLRNIVLNKYALGLNPKKYGIYLYAPPRAELAKYIGLAAAGTIGQNPGFRLISELAHPPISSILEIDPKCGVDSNYCNIIDWAKFGYNEIANEIKIKIPVLESNTGFPLDHRTKTEVMLTGIKNMMEYSDVNER